MPGSHNGMKFRETFGELGGRARGKGVQTHKQVSSVLSRIFCFCKETLWWSSQRGCSALFFPPVLCVLLSLKLNKLLSWQLLLSTWQSVAQPILVLASDALCSASSAQLRGSLLRPHCHFSYLPMLSFSPHRGNRQCCDGWSRQCCLQSLPPVHPCQWSPELHVCLPGCRQGGRKQSATGHMPAQEEIWGSLRCPCDAQPLGYNGLSKPSA